MKPLGIEVTEVTVTQIRITKQNENQALSFINAFVKSDMGTKILGRLESHIRENISSTNVPPNQQYETTNAKLSERIEPRSTIGNATRDPELDSLVQHLRSCCNEKLVSRVGKCFRICCEDALNGPAEVLLDLKEGVGSCEWIDHNTNAQADAEIVLKKETLFSLINGSISPLSAYINGAVTIRGSIADVASLKFLAERAKEIRMLAVHNV